MKNIVETIQKRHSTRVYKAVTLSSRLREQLLTVLKTNNEGLSGEKIDIKLIEKNPEKDGRMKLDYGMIKNHSTYIMGMIKDSVQSRLNYGFALEKIVLKITEMGLDTCWVGYFDHQYFSEFSSGDGLYIPAMVIIGEADDHLSFTDRLMRTLVKSKHRNEWNQLFFNEKNEELTQEEAGEYVGALEMLRLAPSAGNLQPWRVVFEQEERIFHFYKAVRSERYEAAGLHDIDLGIALAHFDIVNKINKLSGSWELRSNQEKNNWNYVLSWKCA